MSLRPLSAAEVTWLYGTPSVHLKSFSSLALVQQGPEESSWLLSAFEVESPAAEELSGELYLVARSTM